VQALLALEQPEPNAYSAAHLPLAQAFGSQAAVALANVGLYEDSLNRAVALDARTTLLNRISAEINNTLEPVELFQAALSALAQALALDQAAAIVFDESRAAGRLRPLVHYPAAEVEQAGALALTANPLLDQLREGLAPIAIEDVANNALVTPEHTAWIAPDLRSALFLPLVVAGKLIGVLGPAPGRRRHFTPSDTNGHDHRQPGRHRLAQRRVVSAHAPPPGRAGHDQPEQPRHQPDH
jgi:GAF domain-containing protein